MEAIQRVFTTPTTTNHYQLPTANYHQLLQHYNNNCNYNSPTTIRRRRHAELHPLGVLKTAVQFEAAARWSPCIASERGRGREERRGGIASHPGLGKLKKLLFLALLEPSTAPYHVCASALKLLVLCDLLSVLKCSHGQFDRKMQTTHEHAALIFHNIFHTKPAPTLVQSVVRRVHRGNVIASSGTPDVAKRPL